MKTKPTQAAKRRCYLFAALLCLVPVLALAQETTAGYQLPPAALQAIVDAPRAPSLSLSPRRDLVAFTQTPSLPGIVEVAQPELKLAGLRINPRTYATSRFSFATDLWLMDLATRTEAQLQGLPQPLLLSSLSWSPDQKYLAFTREDAKAGAVELWLVDIAAKKARKLLQQPLNTVVGSGYSWLPDGRRLLVRLRPHGQGVIPVSDGIPAGPNTQQTEAGGQIKSIRTYQDLLKSEADARVFEHYLATQLAVVDVDGKLADIGKPELWTSASASPDGKHLLITRVERPFSYLVPYNNFPRRIEVRALDGKVEHQVAAIPLIEGLPTGNDAVPTGVRSISWRDDAPATLVWAEAQDGGDPAREAKVRDKVFMQAAPFDRPPSVLGELSMRYGGIDWARGDLALLSEYWWKTRQRKTWRISPDVQGKPSELMWEGSYEDRYNDPGSPMSAPNMAGRSVLIVAGDGESLFLRGEGASPEGDRPFIDRFNLRTKEKTRLFHSQAPYYESPTVLLDNEGKRALITRESPSERPNYYLKDLADANAPLVGITQFPHPTPQLKDVRKELIRYKRNDGVDLTATLYLPPGYDSKRDGPLPTLMWAYPAEFKSAQAASQVTGSPYSFNAISYWGPHPFLAQGYAVVDDFSVPIVGEGDAEPNDSYIPQLVASAEAAIDEVVRRGVTDRNRIAVGGHSYGAFMTANLLAHSRLFKAGIARSGAYNRSLTPFGFQAEERNYWQAQKVYQDMSPFNYAGQIKDALLIIHGADDNNSGTFPIQSERLFAAVKGLGGNARLVMLPKESHGYRARESILHMLFETESWLRRHVKEAPAGGAAK